MTSLAASQAAPGAGHAAAGHHANDAPARDMRLDVFRGLAMFIIFIAHMPGNVWALWIPARFGFSDATEIFVFCSGMASAIAFGRVFERRGWAMGTARIAHRVWQVYWAHIGLFLAIAVSMAMLDATGAFEADYIGKLNLHPFFDRTPETLIGLVTLTYVPNYFDILPMYLVILAMVPLVMGLARVGLGLAAAVLIALWALGTTSVLSLPAEPWSTRDWFFNPFAWQLVFFTGFALMRGWIKPPPVTRGLVALAAIVVLSSVPFAYFRILNAVPDLRAAANALQPLTTKTGFGVLRYVHFLGLAYLAWVAAGPGGARLDPAGLAGRVVSVICTVGRQSLAVFMMGMFAARLFGVFLDVAGRDAFTVAFANLAGFGVLIATAYAVAWFKTQPWRSRPPERQVVRRADTGTVGPAMVGANAP